WRLARGRGRWQGVFLAGSFWRIPVHPVSRLNGSLFPPDAQYLLYGLPVDGVVRPLLKHLPQMTHIKALSTGKLHGQPYKPCPCPRCSSETLSLLGNLHGLPVGSAPWS